MRSKSIDLAFITAVVLASTACNQIAGFDDYTAAANVAHDHDAAVDGKDSGAVVTDDAALTEMDAGQDTQIRTAGQTCATDAECSTEHCVDGVCCQTACTEACMQCDKPDSLGVCAPSAANEPCSNASCDPTSNSVAGAGTCDGAGSCKVPNAASCAPFRCDGDGTKCAASCQSNEACVGQPCLQGSCGLIQNGNACTAGNQCSSGNCVDGVCCGASSCGTCQTCNGSTPGTCSNVPSRTPDPHGRCVADVATCTQGTCNGAGACTPASANTVCKAQCAANGATGGGYFRSASYEHFVCDGTTTGSCTKRNFTAGTDCLGAVCANATTCVASCTKATDCTVGNVCNITSGRCQAFDPAGVVEPADLKDTSVTARTLPSGDVVLDVDRGVITAGGTTIRAANNDVTARELRSGIAYQQRSGQAVFTFGDLTIPEGTTLKLTGTLPVVLTSTGAVSLNGVIDARPMDAAGTLCADLTAGPGGFRGGDGGNACPCPARNVRGNPGMGPGGGSAGTGSSAISGGGGGGHVATGGSGGLDFAGAAGGATYAGPPTRFVGGSGGAGATGYSDGGRASRGGGGGGAVQLVAAINIRIGNGTQAGGINAGGCGGTALGSGGGAGGGSGGTIWLEAPTVQLGPKAVLAANGGGGSLYLGRGEPGALDANRARGWIPDSVPASSACGALIFGGCGGAGDTPAGMNGGSYGTNPTFGCGAGGAAGYIYVATATNGLNRSSTAVFSPSTASAGAATLGTITLR